MKMLPTLCLFLAVLLYGCQEGQQTQEFVADDYTGPVQIDVAGGMETPAANPVYANDLDRLGKLSARINAACRSNYAVVPGANASERNGSIVSIDYGLFDRLSDDGVAVMIAEAIVYKAPQGAPARSVSPTEHRQAVLSGDESAGRIVAMAGFGSGGFAEWLKENKFLTAGASSAHAPDSARQDAFLRGYLAESRAHKLSSN